MLGSGRPKVCVPLVAPTLPVLAADLTGLDPAHFDLVELRVDVLLGSAEDLELVRNAIGMVRQALPVEVPVLVTYRTTREGGEQEISVNDYVAVLEAAVATGQADAVDLEMMTPAESLDRVMAAARAGGTTIVTSFHDFAATPPKEELIARLRTQQDLGADVVKLAVMPSSARDVLTLLDATEEFVTSYARVPVITMAMGLTGVISRLSGETFGSCLTFGSVGRTSAPGQLPADELRRILELLHRSR